MKFQFFQNDKRKEWQEFFNSEVDEFRSYILRHIPDREEAKDLISSCFLELYEAWHKAENKKAYLYFIGKHRIFNIHKKQEIRNRYAEYIIRVSPKDGENNALSSEMIQNFIESVLKSIDIEDKPYFFYMVTGKTQVEIAEIMNVTQKTVSKKKEKIKEFAKQHLKTHGLSEIG